MLHVTIKQPDLSVVTPIIPLCLRKPPPSSFFAVAPSHINSRQLLYFYHYELLCCKLDASELVFAQKSTQHNNKDYLLIATGIFIAKASISLPCYVSLDRLALIRKSGSGAPKDLLLGGGHILVFTDCENN